MIPQEELKLKIDGLDSLELIKEYAKTGFASIPAEHFGLMRWYGAYQQKPNQGHFMLRIKFGGGQVNAEQLREVASIAHDHGRDLADITTRQNIQFHWLTIETLAETIERLQSVGLSTTGACGDVTRNVVGCPAAGLDRNEVIDAQPLLKRVEKLLLGNRKYSNLPRKFKISISGCCIGCAQPLINDIGITAVRHRTDPENIKYVVVVGGGLSTTPKFAQDLGVLLGEEDIPDVCEQITGIFRDYGNRENRKRARMKFLVEQWGADKFRETIEDRLGRSLPRWSDDFVPATYSDDDHVGVFPQKQDGLVYVGVPVKVGRMHSSQLVQIADAADHYGNGEIRFTNHQNFIIPNVAEASVPKVIEAMGAAGFEVNAPQTRRLLVACTGNQFCNLALSETKQTASRISDHLEKVIPHDEGIRIHLSGCPNSCAQFQTGDIGLTGVTFQPKGETEKVEAYNIFAGGGYGDNPTFGRRLSLKVPKENLPEFLAGVYQKYSDQRQNGETFQQFANRLSDAEVMALGETNAA